MEIVKPGSYLLEGADLAVTRVGFTYASVKIIYKSIDFVKQLFGIISSPWLVLSDHLKRISELIESTRIFSSVNEVFCPDAQGRYLFTNPQNSWQKIAERVAFCAHTFFKCLSGCLQWELINLGKLVQYSIGHLTIFKAVTDALFGLTSFFCVWSSKLQLVPVNKELSRVDAILTKLKTNIMPSQQVVVQVEVKHYEKLKEQLTQTRFSLLLKIGTYVTKVLLIPMAMVFTALQLETAPFMLCLLGLGLIGDSMGFVRSYSDEFAKRMTTS